MISSQSQPAPRLAAALQVFSDLTAGALRIQEPVMLAERLKSLAEELAGLAVEIKAQGSKSPESITPLLNAQGAAELLGISPSTVRDLTSQGLLPNISMSPPNTQRRIIRYDPHRLRQWWTERTEGGDAD